MSVEYGGCLKNMEKDLISVIIPVYNNEKYFSKCITSVLNQTYKNIEIIIINDCSTDNSEKIILDYKAKDKRIIYLSNEKNIGVGRSRNIGIEHAKGKYIYFLDSDDFIEETALANLYNAIKEDDSFSCMTKGYKNINNEDIAFSRSEEELTLLQSPSVCIRLFNKEIIDKSKIRFSNLPIGEDLEFVFKLMIYNDKFSYVNNKPLYHYVIHSDSSIHGSVQKQLSVLEAINSIEEYAKQLNKFDKFYDRLEFVNISHILRGTIKRIMRLENYKKEDIITCISYVENKYPNWKKNKYLEKYLSNDIEFLMNLNKNLNQ